MSAADPSTTLAFELAESLRAAFISPVPDDVLERAAIQLFDAIACAAGAFDSEPVRIAREATGGSGPAEASVFFTGTRVNVLDAILCNGTAVRFLDYNDAFIGAGPGGHPSDNLVAAVAVGEQRGCTGRDILAAAALGYELFWRFRQTVYRGTHEGEPWDGVSVSAVVSAAIAGLLMNLDTSRLANALAVGLAKGYALKQLRRGSISMIKASANALVARDGVLAARLAELGMTGPPEIIEGHSGVLRAFGIADEPSARSALTAAPTWAIHRVSIKAYPAIATSQAAIDAALRIAEKHDLTSGIRHVEVRMPDSKATREHMEIEQRQRPDSRESADHSLPFLVAAALQDGQLSLPQFTDERWHRPDTTALMRRIQVVPDPGLVTDKQSNCPAVVTVELQDGTIATEAVLEVPGSPSAPWGFADVERKLAGVDRAGLPAAQRAALAAAAAKLPQAESISALIDATATTTVAQERTLAR